MWVGHQPVCTTTTTLCALCVHTPQAKGGSGLVDGYSSVDELVEKADGFAEVFPGEQQQQQQQQRGAGAHLGARCIRVAKTGQRGDDDTATHMGVQHNPPLPTLLVCQVVHIQLLPML
jgi:hypothetical protein